MTKSQYHLSKSVSSKNIKIGQIIRYTAYHYDQNDEQHTKIRNFLVSDVDPYDKSIQLLPITHSGYNSNNHDTCGYQYDPYNRNNIQFSKSLQDYMNRQTNTDEISYFQPTNALEISYTDLDKANAKLTGEIDTINNRHLLTNIIEQVHYIQRRVVDANIAYINEKNERTTPDFEAYKLKTGEWVSDDMIKKMNISEDIIGEKPLHENNMRPVLPEIDTSGIESNDNNNMPKL